MKNKLSINNILLQFYVTAIFLKSHASHSYTSEHHCDEEKCPPTGKKHMFASQRSNAESV